MLVVNLQKIETKRDFSQRHGVGNVIKKGGYLPFIITLNLNLHKHGRTLPVDTQRCSHTSCRILQSLKLSAVLFDIRRRSHCDIDESC